MALLNDLKFFFEGNGYLSREKYPKINSRFWNQLRVDVMRQPPERLKNYLQQQTRLKDEEETGALGPALVVKFASWFDEHKRTRQFQEELVNACLELDAALKYRELAGSGPCDKAKLQKQLAIWG